MRTAPTKLPAIPLVRALLVTGLLATGLLVTGLGCIAACSPATPEGTRRPLTDHWGKEPGSAAALVRFEGEEVFHDGEWRKDGPAVFHDPDGKAVRRGQYELGLETGRWRETYEDGATGQGEYLRGERHGPWTIYHANGPPQESGSYEHGRREGRWMWYYSTGAPRSESTWSAGEKDGKITFWRPDGTLERSETWSAGGRVD